MESETKARLGANTAKLREACEALERARSWPEKDRLARQILALADERSQIADLSDEDAASEVMEGVLVAIERHFSRPTEH